MIPIFFDFETQSACNLRRHGAYVYAEHPSTNVLCAALGMHGCDDLIFWTPYRYDGLVMPEHFVYEHGIEFLIDMVTSQPVRIEAHNHSFERAIWTRCLPRYAAEKGLVIPEPAEWGDTMDIMLSRSLPAGLDAAGDLLFRMPKDPAGQAALRSIWGPDRSGKVPTPTTAQIQAIVAYNAGDTLVTSAICHQFGNLMPTAEEERVRRLHSKINHRGIHLDQPFARTLRDWDEVFKARAAEEVSRITNGAIKRSDLTRREFLRQQLNTQLPSHLYLQNMRADTLEALIDPDNEYRDDLDADVESVVKNYLVFSRAALSKVERALNVVAADGRAHAQLRYWGATTGRWSGYEIQPQNLKRPSESLDIEAANRLVEERCEEMAAGRWTPEMDAAMLEDFKALCQDEPPYELLGSLIRGILHPGPGRVFVVGDFAQVEARGVLYLAGDMDGLVEHRASDRGGPDSYCVLASSMFGREVTKKDKKERAAGKVGILACGFGGGANAVSRMASSMGIDLQAAGINAQFVVDGYRRKYPKVVKMWSDCEYAFRRVLDTGREYQVGPFNFIKHPDCVQIILPSGRALTYTNARICDDPYGKRDREGYLRRVIAYDVATKGKPVARTTYGGKIYENCFGQETLVLCRNGCKPISEVTASDEVWDGVEWVHTAGAKSMGVQEVGSWLGTRVTANHRILVGNSWRAVMHLGAEHTLAALSLGRASVQSSSCGLGVAMMRSVLSGATAGVRGRSTTAASSAGRLGAASAVGMLRGPTGLKVSGMSTSSPTPSCGCVGSIGTPEWFPAALTPDTGPTPTTGGAASRSATSGCRTGRHSCATPSPSTGGTKTVSTSTASIMRGGTSRGTSAWSNGGETYATSAARYGSNTKAYGSTSSTFCDCSPPSGPRTPCAATSGEEGRQSGVWRAMHTSIPVFDLLNCGPRHRFTVITDAGPVIAHNCTQAFCRDLLANRMLVLDDEGMDLDFHVHDEAIASVPEEDGPAAVAFMAEVFRDRDVPSWAKGFPLWSKPEVMTRYGKG